MTMPTKPVEQSKPKFYQARKLVIVSGGTLSSLLILQRSGIGDPEKLRKVGVKPRSICWGLASTSKTTTCTLLFTVPSLR